MRLDHRMRAASTDARYTRGGRQSRALIDDSRQDLPQGTLGFLGIAQGVLQAEAFGHGVQGKHGPHSETLFQDEVLAEASQFGEIAFVLERRANGGDFRLRVAGKVGDGPMPNLAVVAIGMAEQMGSVGFAVDGLVDGVDSHRVHIIHIATA